jgi:hypothetical protein
MFCLCFWTKLRKGLPLLAALAGILLGWSSALAAPKQHVITFGRWISAKWPDASGEKMLDLKVRPLLVDTRVKEYTTGSPHEATDRLFVVQRVSRINDALPGETAPRWQWQRGGWLLVDRLTGRVSPLSLPEFDPYYSTASWYRDYVAYCGVSEDGKKVYAMVAQIGRRKPLLKSEAEPEPECIAPAWERNPMRVTFRMNDRHKVVFGVRRRVVDVVSDGDEAEE